MLADHIAETAHRHGISLERARDAILKGEIFNRGGYVEPHRQSDIVTRAMGVIPRRV